MTYYLEMRTMTKWRKVGDKFEPISDLAKINRTAEDVFAKAIFQGPYMLDAAK
jgi:hypothetical protein